MTTGELINWLKEHDPTGEMQVFTAIDDEYTPAYPEIKSVYKYDTDKGYYMYGYTGSTEFKGIIV